MNPQTKKCYFCGESLNPNEVSSDIPKDVYYKCKLCGDVYLEEWTARQLVRSMLPFRGRDQKILSIWNRNEFEKRGGESPPVPLTDMDLRQVIKNYHPKDPLEKMDIALWIIEKKTQCVGDKIMINVSHDYPLYHCFFPGELTNILILLTEDNFIKADDTKNPQSGLRLSIKGYERIRELEKLGVDSNQCFVAMWFNTQMNKVFEDAIKPAIELDDDETTNSGYEAIRIDTVEHANDVNDEIIAQIRRTKFMVCDLTGYRGGVYFEAGFAYGLGLTVIYTCRNDWADSQPLFDKHDNEIKYLFNENKKQVPIQQEGIHFDLAHRNRIEWYDEDLDDFRIKLRKRIQAVIV